MDREAAVAEVEEMLAFWEARLSGLMDDIRPAPTARQMAERIVDHLEIS